MSDGIFSDALSGISESIQQLKQQKQALEAQVFALQSTKKEAEDWLNANFQKYVDAKGHFEFMQRKVRAMRPEVFPDHKAA
jgi:hypothetical protein